MVGTHTVLFLPKFQSKKSTNVIPEALEVKILITGARVALPPVAVVRTDSTPILCLDTWKAFDVDYVLNSISNES